MSKSNPVGRPSGQALAGRILDLYGNDVERAAKAFFAVVDERGLMPTAPKVQTAKEIVVPMEPEVAVLVDADPFPTPAQESKAAKPAKVKVVNPREAIVATVAYPSDKPDAGHYTNIRNVALKGGKEAIASYVTEKGYVRPGVSKTHPNGSPRWRYAASLYKALS